MNIALTLRNATPVDPNNLNQSDQIWTYSASVADNLNDAPVTQQVTLAAGGSEVVPLTVDDIFQTNITITCALPDTGGTTTNNHQMVLTIHQNPTTLGVVQPLDPIFTVLLNGANTLTVSATLE